MLKPVAGAERVGEDRTWQQSAADGLSHEECPQVARGTAPGGLHEAGVAQPNRREFLGLRSGLSPGPERACLPKRLGGDRQRRIHLAGSLGEGDQANRGEFREVPDRPKLKPEC